MKVRIPAFAAFCALAATHSYAAGGADTAKWQFLPEVGIAGMASIWGENHTQMAVECGNGGEPVITLGLLPRPGVSATLSRVALDFQVDGRTIPEEFECYPGEDSCSSTTFEPGALIAALRTGKRVAIAQHGKPVFDFTLNGSNAAIARLRDCGG